MGVWGGPTSTPTHPYCHTPILPEALPAAPVSWYNGSTEFATAALWPGGLKQMYGLEPTHLIIVAIVVLVLFGPKRLPELAKGLGQGIKDFKKALHHEEEPPKEEPTAIATHEEESKTPTTPAA